MLQLTMTTLCLKDTLLEVTILFLSLECLPKLKSQIMAIYNTFTNYLVLTFLAKSWKTTTNSYFKYNYTQHTLLNTIVFPYKVFYHELFNL